MVVENAGIDGENFLVDNEDVEEVVVKEEELFWGGVNDFVLERVACLPSAERACEIIASGY